MKQEFVSDSFSGSGGFGTTGGGGRVTVRAIAAETELSIATVSRVLNGGENVARRTRERVREVVEQLGDRAPTPRKRPPARAARPPVFVRCPYLLTDYFGHIVTSIAETLAVHGQEMMLSAGDAVFRSTALRDLPQRRDARGAVLILPPEPRADLETLAARSYPFVVVDPRIDVPRGTVLDLGRALLRRTRRHPASRGPRAPAHRRDHPGPPYWHYARRPRRRAPRRALRGGRARRARTDAARRARDEDR